MIDPNISYTRNVDYSNIGCIICRTPKTLKYSVSDKTVDHHCELVTSTQEMIKYFGDPFVSPSDYPELVLASKLLDNGAVLYISSIDDVSTNNDGFRIGYNGYTEFTFINDSLEDLVGYRLKSAIKFCQPVLSVKYSQNKLYLHIQLYLLDYSSTNQLYRFDKSRLYTEFTAVLLDNGNLSDRDIIDCLAEHDIELKVINSHNDDKALVSAFKESGYFEIKYESYIDSKFSTEDIQGKWPNDVVIFLTDEKYHYKINTDNYNYSLDDDNSILHAYHDAINRMVDLNPEPHFLCLDRVLKSHKVYDSHNHVVKQHTDQSDFNMYMHVYSILTDTFTSDCNTYVLMNTPSMSSSSIMSNLINVQYDYLLDNYNADLFYGYVWDTIYRYRNSDLSKQSKVFYSAALLTFYNLLSESTVYIANSVGNLNISNNCARSCISENAARTLSELHCNSIVMFDTGMPSVFGNTTLSSLPNLSHSHISRNFVRIRRLIREYLETKKFMLNTVFNQDSCAAYIRTQILDVFKSNGVLSNYDINFTSSNKSILVNIDLMFYSAAENLNLNFTI